MAHNLATLANGQKAYIGKESGWHELGIVTGQYQKWSDLCAHGLNFPVDKQQLRDPWGNPIDAWGTFRMDTAPPTLLYTVGAKYPVIHHSEGFDMIDALVGEIDGAHYATAGALGNGGIVWGLAALNIDIHVGDDVIKNYLLFKTGYGRDAFSVGKTSTRVVCQNTLNQALSSKSASVFNVRHTRNARERLQDARRALVSIREEMHDTEAKLNFLAQRQMTREALTDILDRVFPKAKKDGDNKAESSARRDNILKDIIYLYDKNDDDAFPEQRGTAYALLNAITDYVDHQMSAKNDQRALSAMVGNGNDRKNNAFEIILEQAGNLQVVTRREVLTSSPAPLEIVDHSPQKPVGFRSSQPSLLDQIIAGNN